MSSSPCILRSAHCAALIALAAVAGLVRVEPTAPRPQAESAFGLVYASPLERYLGHSATTSDSIASRFHFASATTTPWLRQLAVIAAWFVQADRPAHVAKSALSSSSRPAPAPAPASAVAPAPAAALPLPTTSLAAALPAGFAAEPAPALCTYAQLIPLPAGPPAFVTSATPLAAGTMVPGDSAAPGMFVRSISLSAAPADEVSSMARLARKSDLGTVSAGSAFKNSPVSFIACAVSRRATDSTVCSLATPARSAPSTASLA